MGVVLPKAHARFVSPYALTDFSLFNSPGANGEASSPDRGATVISIGTHTSLDDPGIRLGIVSAQRRRSIFLRIPAAHWERFQFLASGGDLTGFRVDNIGESGVLAISNCDARTTNPSAFWFIVTGAVLWVIRGRNLTPHKEPRGIFGVMILVVGGSLFTTVTPMRAQVQSQFTGADISGN